MTKVFSMVFHENTANIKKTITRIDLYCPLFHWFILDLLSDSCLAYVRLFLSTSQEVHMKAREIFDWIFTRVGTLLFFSEAYIFQLLVVIPSLAVNFSFLWNRSFTAQPMPSEAASVPLAPSISHLIRISFLLAKVNEEMIDHGIEHV